MRALVLALILGLSGPAFADVLPITGKYCAPKSADGTAPVTVNTDGQYGEEDALFATAAPSGPDSWIVTYKAPFDDNKDTITISPDRKTLTVTSVTGSLTLHACR